MLIELIELIGLIGLIGNFRLRISDRGFRNDCSESPDCGLRNADFGMIVRNYIYLIKGASALPGFPAFKPEA